MSRKLTPTEIDYVRKEIINIMSKYDKRRPPIKLDVDGELLQQILFENCIDITTNKPFYDFLSLFEREGIYEKIDFSNIPLNNVLLDGKNLSKYKGVKIDPQVIYGKSLVETICAGAEFVGSFDDVCVVATDFRGSRGAKVDPQTIRNQDFLLTKWNEGDIEFVGSFAGCYGVNPSARTGRR